MTTTVVPTVITTHQENNNTSPKMVPSEKEATKSEQKAMRRKRRFSNGFFNRTPSFFIDPNSYQDSPIYRMHPDELKDAADAQKDIPRGSSQQADREKLQSNRSGLKLRQYRATVTFGEVDLHELLEEEKNAQEKMKLEEDCPKKPRRRSLTLFPFFKRKAGER